MKNLYKNFTLSIFSIALFFATIPSRVFAAVDPQTCEINGSLENIRDLVVLATCFISRYIIPLLFAVAIVFFIFGMVRFIKNADNESERTKGQQFMIWSIVALFVMVSVWGIVNLFRNTFTLNNSTPGLPTLPIGEE